MKTSSNESDDEFPFHLVLTIYRFPLLYAQKAQIQRHQRFDHLKSNRSARASHRKLERKYILCEVGCPGVLDGARLGLTGRDGTGPSDMVGDWQGLVRGEELGEVPRPELEDSWRCWGRISSTSAL